MIIRVMKPDDFEQLKNIHEQFYSDDFSFKEFIGRKWLDKFVIANDSNEIVVAGGIRLITECIAITDKSKSTRERREALLLLLEASKFTSGRNGYEGIHSFVDESDPNWIEILKKYGFSPTKNQALYLQVR